MNVLKVHVVEDVSIDERSKKVVTLAVEIVGRLGRGESELFDELVMSVVGGSDGGQWSRKGSAKNAFYREFEWPLRLRTRAECTGTNSLYGGVKKR